ncbi:MAG: sulfurtransferase TusA [Hyphomicrobiales bacterium]|nr:sulfurtransferase TusA [Hyphomicrobiales bacterium]
MTALQDIAIDQELDAKGLNCPLPILRTRKAMSDMTTGQILRVVATDPGSCGDIPAFCNQTGHELVATGEAGGTYEFLIRKS